MMKGKDKDKGKSEMGVRNVHNGEPEIRADAPRGTSSATNHNEILPMSTVATKRDDEKKKKRQSRALKNFVAAN